MADVISIGEPLFEFNAQQAGSLETVTDFKPGFGGDTSNAMISAARMGASTGYICRIGNDAFGTQFLHLWQQEGVDTTHVIVDKENPTGIYFISRDEAGHHFAYYRKHSAASFLTPQDISETAITNAKVLHASGISQAISTSVCDAIFHAIDIAKSANVTVTYDPNLRLKLWNIGRARAVIMETVRQSDVVLAGQDEMSIILDVTEPEQIVEVLLKHGAKAVVLKMGHKGVMFTSNGILEHISPIDVNVVDATGAGDTFDGAFCAGLAEGRSMDETARFANIAAGLSVTKQGAVGAIPKRTEIMEYMG